MECLVLARRKMNYLNPTLQNPSNTMANCLLCYIQIVLSCVLNASKGVGDHDLSIEVWEYWGKVFSAHKANKVSYRSARQIYGKLEEIWFKYLQGHNIKKKNLSVLF